VIVGGLSAANGLRAQPCDAAQLRWMRQVCAAARVPLFVKRNSVPRGQRGEYGLGNGGWPREWPDFGRVDQ